MREAWFDRDEAGYTLLVIDGAPVPAPAEGFDIGYLGPAVTAVARALLGAFGLDIEAAPGVARTLLRRYPGPPVPLRVRLRRRDILAATHALERRLRGTPPSLVETRRKPCWLV
ncbi:MAG: hypothetical protein HQL40_14980 [Alphaproteobacteria bacterium]|nr:hypothetical protein [Alphaproteobacteria bacterium]